MRMVVCVAGCLLLGAAAVRAQDVPADLKSLAISANPLPAGSLLNPTGDKARWVITSTIMPGTPAPNPPVSNESKPSVMTISKSGKTYLVESVGPDGTKMTRWKDSQLQATYFAGVSDPVISYSPNTPNYLDYTKSDFPELSWISGHNYVGITKLGPVNGLVFKAEVSTRGGQLALLSGPHAAQSKAIAVLDAVTRKPLLLQVDNELLHYQFIDSAVDLSLPADLQKTFNTLRKRIEQASLVPPG